MIYLDVNKNYLFKFYSIYKVFLSKLQEKKKLGKLITICY
jgi:hypothetical protein